MKIEISGSGDLSDPRQRVLAIEAAAKAICAIANTDPADAVMQLLTAACHLTAQHGRKNASETLSQLAYSLGCASVAAEKFFELKAVVPREAES